MSLTSNPLNYDVQPGTDYFIGAILDVPARFRFALGVEVQGPVTQIAANGNMFNFLSPERDGAGGTVIAVSLSGSVPTPIPLPAAGVLLIGALGCLAGLGAGQRRRAA